MASHAEYDIEHLGVDASLTKDFCSNSIEWMRATLEIASIQDVTVVKSDATQFDFDRCSPIALALLDVDLYQPIYDILPKLYKRLSSGGVIIVDDCAHSPKWEGALVAYRQFMKETGKPENIVCGKLGIIRKP